MTASEHPQAHRLTHLLLNDIDGAHCVLMASADGLAWAHAARSDLDTDRLAAIVSSLGALGSAAALATGAGPLQCLVVEGDAGRVVARMAHVDGQPVLVAVCCDTRATLGMVRVQLNALDTR
ncbi:roadblock/LC7 domain-containing protein [Ideonella margarita]|uniref:Roadblock/LC7 domain-containing protein n=1 Tax=Ideonella margarita TaxID=2984191 RepID=A0ABU9CA48_9BURK